MTKFLNKDSTINGQALQNIIYDDSELSSDEITISKHEKAVPGRKVAPKQPEISQEPTNYQLKSVKNSALN